MRNSRTIWAVVGLTRIFWTSVGRREEGTETASSYLPGQVERVTRAVPFLPRVSGSPQSLKLWIEATVGQQ